MDQETPCACNIHVFTKAEKQRHSELMGKLHSAMLETKELPDGYAFRLQNDAISLVEVAEWIAHEHNCCPFFDFEVELQHNSGPLWLKLRGTPNVKEFLRPDAERNAVFVGMPN